MEQTLSIIKPDAVKGNHIGAILARFERAGLRVVAAKMGQLTESQAKIFYAVHRDKPFFGELVAFITSGPVLLSVLQGEGAVGKNREIMGATDPQKAAVGTIRADFGASIDVNAVHGSDALDTAREEINLFFAQLELFGSAFSK